MWIHLEVNIYFNAHSLSNTIQNRESAREEIWTETVVLRNPIYKSYKNLWPCEHVANPFPGSWKESVKVNPEAWASLVSHSINRYKHETDLEYSIKKEKKKKPL